MKAPLKTIEKGLDVVDKMHYSGEDEGRILGERHKTDMMSDNFLSKAVRPVIMFTLLALLVASVFGLEIPAKSMEILDSWGYLGITFYFGSRAAQHLARIVKGESRQTRKDERQDVRLKRKSEK